MVSETVVTAKQNDSTQLLRLRAMRVRYRNAALLAAGTSLSAAALAIVGPILTVNSSWTAPWIGLVGICLAALEILFLKPRELSLRQSAAAIQERFDCDVLDLPWNPIAVDESPAPEPVAATTGDDSDSSDDLRNWYSSDVDALPLSAARLVCQRANLYSDSDLRKPYAVFLTGVAVGVPLMLVIWALASGRDVATVLVVLAAGLPLVLWAGQEASNHNEAADRVNRLRKCADDIWKNLIANLLTQPAWERIDEGQYVNASRSLQDQIYIHRRESPKVPDWFYKRSREKEERQMAAAVRELVGEFQRASRH